LKNLAIMRADVQNVLNLVVVFAILAALTAGIDLNQFRRRVKKPKGILIGLLCQFGILPVGSFLTAYLLNDTFDAFTVPQGVALIILGSCPGGNISNIFCFLWNADLSLSIAMTTASSIFSFLFLTANLALYIPIFTRGSDLAEIDYTSLAFSVGMVLLGLLTGFAAAYLEHKGMKLVLRLFGLIAALYMIWTALFGNASGSAPIWTLPPAIWLAPTVLCAIAWILSLAISAIFRLPKKAILTVCLESANQNSVLSAAIIYLSLDEYSPEDIDLAIGIPIMYTLISVLFDAVGGFICCQLQWVHCSPPDHVQRADGAEVDETVTFSHVLHRYRMWKQEKQSERNLLGPEGIDYGGVHTEISMEHPSTAAAVAANSEETRDAQ